jgi:hypothetical protein
MLERSISSAAARATTGADWPDGSPGPIPGRAIILTAEDRKEDSPLRCCWR